MGFHSNGETDLTFPIRLTEYLELTDWTGRAIREGKTGLIPEHLDRFYRESVLDQTSGCPRCNTSSGDSIEWRDAGKLFKKLSTSLKPSGSKESITHLAP